MIEMSQILHFSPTYTHMFWLILNDKVADFHSLHLALTPNTTSQGKVLNVSGMWEAREDSCLTPKAKNMT